MYIYIILYNYIWCYFQPPWTWDWWFTNSKCKTSPLRAEPFDPQLSMGPDQCLSVLLSAVGTTENVIGHNRTCLYSSRVVHPNFTPQAVDLDQPLQCIFEGQEANERPNQSKESNIKQPFILACHSFPCLIAHQALENKRKRTHPEFATRSIPPWGSRSGGTGTSIATNFSHCGARERIKSNCTSVLANQIKSACYVVSTHQNPKPILHEP